MINRLALEGVFEGWGYLEFRFVQGQGPQGVS